MHHQGRIAVEEVLFDGPGRFKFAFVNADASQVFWHNAPDGDGDGEPDQPVSIRVSRGLYSVLLGDVSLAHMAPLSPDVFAQPAVYLRVWFDDGVRGSQRLFPDQRLAAVGYAMVAASVPDGAISAAKLAPGTLDGLSAQIAALTANLADLTRRHEALAASVVSGLPEGVPVVSSEAADPDLLALGLSPFMNVPGQGWRSGGDAGGSDGPPRPFRDLDRPGPAGLGRDPRRRRALGRRGQLRPGVGPMGAAAGRRGSGGAAGSHRRVDGRSDAGVRRAGCHLPEHGCGVFAGRLFLVPLATTDAPAAREGHLAVWTGARMLVWGGRNAAGLLADGGLYDPGARTWQSVPALNAPAGRVGAAGVWTGAQFIVWGGTGESGELGSGAQLPVANGMVPGAWMTLSAVNAPSARSGHTAVWTGQRLLVWGGRSGDTFRNDGAAYDPERDLWSPLPTAGAPAPRDGHLAAWTGREMLIVGGNTAGGPTATGGAYDPASGTWRTLSGAGSPRARTDAAGAWTGAELLVFGGRVQGVPVAALQRLNPQPTWYFYRKP
ncbi:MAG: hypothetical protein M5U12_33360 [Verrucomicrobia bacterium]|nr:hypothetical protein [Verrucomicrobiota bacterium]